jgi:hypothetical protein
MRWLIAALVALLLAPAGASAVYPTGADSLAIADAYWGPHPCRGRVVVTVDPTLPARGHDGEAPGIAIDASGGWRRVSCVIALAPDLAPDVACEMTMHEIGHLIYGPSHRGRMAHYDARPCFAAGWPVAPRRQLIDAIRADLPTPRAAWRISCTPNGMAMRCRATRPHARYARRTVGAWVSAEAADFARLVVVRSPRDRQVSRRDIRGDRR